MGLKNGYSPHSPLSFPLICRAIPSQHQRSGLLLSLSSTLSSSLLRSYPLNSPLTNWRCCSISWGEKEDPIRDSRSFFFMLIVGMFSVPIYGHCTPNKLGNYSQ